MSNTAAGHQGVSHSFWCLSTLCAPTSVTAKLRLPQGTTLYHLSCSMSMKPSDLYWLTSSEMLEVSGEF